MSTSVEKGLVADVTNGVLKYEASKDTKEAAKRGTSELGKDAFLQLLVCQMENQDPLNPSTDTEFVSQLAQFSQLEQLQNLSAETEKTQAFSLVGKYAIFQITDTNGKTTYPEGVVDFVNISGSKVTLSVNGTTYDYDKLYTVVNDAYYMEENRPKLEKSYSFTYNAKAPEDMQFEADFGSNEYKATETAIVVNGMQVDGSYLDFKDDSVIIKAGAFDGLENGEYAVSVIFNDSLLTTVNDKITLKVVNAEENTES